jgi:hypothetical protein
MLALILQVPGIAPLTGRGRPVAHPVRTMVITRAAAPNPEINVFGMEIGIMQKHIFFSLRGQSGA